MKIRTGFVSNSSSASFVVPKSALTYLQGQQLLAYNTADENTDGWTVREDGDRLVGWTSMDNGDMEVYMRKIGIIKDPVQWEDLS